MMTPIEKAIRISRKRKELILVESSQTPLEILDNVIDSFRFNPTHRDKARLYFNAFRVGNKTHFFSNDEDDPWGIQVISVPKKFEK